MEDSRILLAAQNALFREGLKHVLAKEKHAVVREEQSLQTTLSFLRSTNQPVDLIIYEPTQDQSMELECFTAISDEFPQVIIVVLTGVAISDGLESAIRGKARGILPNTISAAALNLVIQLLLAGENLMAVAAGTSVCSERNPAVTQRNVSEPRSALSPREDDILELLMEGTPNKVIARKLNMAEATVKVHVKALLRKTEVSNRTQLAIWGLSRSAATNPTLTELTIS